MSFLIGKIRKGRGACTVGRVTGVRDDFRLDQGIPVAHDWPEDAHFKMSDNFPKDVLLEDYVRNGSNALVVSERLKALLESEHAPAVEYLPVTIFNHKGRKEKPPYFVVNCIAHQDCIDLGKTVATRNKIDPDILSDVQNLTIDPKRVAPELLLFRMKEYPFIDVYRERLAEKIKAAKLTGVKFVKPEEWSII